MAHPFERQIVNAYNDFFDSQGLRGLAYRLKQGRFTAQVVDVLVDSPDPAYYLAIECKSINAKKYNKLYFSSNFQPGQVEGHNFFCSLTGRTGLIAVELRRTAGNEAYLIPLRRVLKALHAGATGLSVEDIRAYPRLRRRSGKYLFEVMA